MTSKAQSTFHIHTPFFPQRPSFIFPLFSLLSFKIWFSAPATLLCFLKMNDPKYAYPYPAQGTFLFFLGGFVCFVFIFGKICYSFLGCMFICVMGFHSSSIMASFFCVLYFYSWVSCNSMSTILGDFLRVLPRPSSDGTPTIRSSTTQKRTRFP